jgi:hypothetical protein
MTENPTPTNRSEQFESNVSEQVVKQVPRDNANLPDMHRKMIRESSSTGRATSARKPLFRI